MDIVEFNHYRDFAYRYFCLVCGLINKTCYVANFTIGLDPEDSKYGELVYPNTLIIYLNNILSDFAVHDVRCSVICLSITHELFHIDQLMNLREYGSSDQYKAILEQQTEIASNLFLNRNAIVIQSVMGFKLLIPNRFKIDDSIMVKDQYESLLDEEYYIQTITNICTRNPANKDVLKAIFMKNKNISIKFQEDNEICIKHNGKYCRDAIPYFIDSVNKYCAFFSTYTINVFTKRIDKNSIVIRLEIGNIQISPIY